MMVMEIPQKENSLAILLKDIADLDFSENRNISGITLDSRKVRPGYLFIAYQGVNVNGCDFIDAAIAAGAIAVLWESVPKIYPLQIARHLESGSSIPVIAINNLREHVSIIASRFYGNPSHKLNVVGITGTNGKTSCSHFLSQFCIKKHLLA